MKLAEYFFDKGFLFEKIYLKEDTELIISNRHIQIINFDGLMKNKISIKTISSVGFK